MNKEQLQKAVEDVRKNGDVLKVTFNIDAKKYAEVLTYCKTKEDLLEEARSLFDDTFEILNAYKKKYEGK